LARNGTQRFEKSVLVLKAVGENLNHDQLSFVFPPKNAPGSRKTLIVTVLPAASECRPQDLVGGGDQMRRRLDP
jgi:hypothetical protein